MNSRRTWPQRINLVVAAAVVTAVAAAGVALLVLDGEVAAVQRVTIAGSGQLAPTGAADATDPVTLLVVGVDNASGLDGDDSVLIGRDPTSMLTDTILLIRIDPATGVVNVMSVPRDLWVPIAGTGTEGKINSAMTVGGPSALVGTIKEALGVDVNHFVQVNFSGFRNAVDALDGVPLVFATPARDLNSGLAIEEPGCFTLDGQQALSLVRSRYYESQQGGVWAADPLSDRSRVQRQQVFLRAAVERAVGQGARNPMQLRALFDAIKDDVILDDTLTLERLIGVGDRFRGASMDNLTFFTLPTVDGWAGAASVVYLQPDAPLAVAAFTDTAARPPATSGGVNDPFVDPAPVAAAPPDTTPFVPRPPAGETCP